MSITGYDFEYAQVKRPRPFEFRIPLGAALALAILRASNYCCLYANNPATNRSLARPESPTHVWNPVNQVTLYQLREVEAGGITRISRG